MDDPLFHRETAPEFFRNLVESTLERQRIEAEEHTAWYLVNLLCGFVHLDRSPSHGAPLDEEPLALRLARALESGGAEQRARLRRLGDISLFVSGFFSDSLKRRPVDVDYYVALGGFAYASLGRRQEDALSPIFAELAEKFVGFVDVLSEVSERTSLASNADLLRLYEKWLRTGSRRDGQLLVERGIVPNSSIGGGFLQ